MTDLDRLLELHNNHAYIGKSGEYQSLYEKLKKAEELSNEFINLKDNEWFRTIQYQLYKKSLELKSDSITRYFATSEGWNEWLDNAVKNELLHQNQKTQEDIEKYNRMIETVNNLMQEVDKRETEIQKLSEDNKQLKEELKHSSEWGNELYRKLQDSKTNAEIVEGVKEWYDRNDYSCSECNRTSEFDELQSILKETK